MSYRNRTTDKARGFTIIELLVVMSMIAIIMPLVTTFFWTTINNFLRVQQASLLVANETRVIGRIEQVVRSGTQIDAASANQLTIYAYFSPTDSVLSKVTYNYNATQKTLTVDKILATGTAPNYTYNVANKVTATLLSGVTLVSDLFSYEDAVGGTGPFDTTTYQNIKIVDIRLNGKVTGNTAPTDISSSVLLRNRRAGY